MYHRTVAANDRVITKTFYAADEETATDATGDVTGAISREDGTALTGATIATNNGNTGQYDLSLTAAAHLTRVDVLTVTWTATVAGRAVSETDYVAVVGGRYFTVADLRSQRGLGSTSSFPAEDLIAARDVAEGWIENYCRHAWVASYAREVFDGDSSSRVQLNHLDIIELISVSIDGTSQDLTDWTVNDSGRLLTDGAIFTIASPAGHNVEVQYKWGKQLTPPDLSRAARDLAKHILLTVDSSIPDRARMMQTEWGLFHLDKASEDHPTGIPEIDAVIKRYARARPDWIFG